MLYAPTGERHNSMETMGEELIAKLGAVDRYDLLVKPHDHPHSTIDWWERLAPLETEHVRLVHERDVIHTLSIADLLITDASSVANEYTLLDRPIVFIDVPELFELTLRKHARLDLETWGRRGGEVADGVSEALDAVESGLARSWRTVRRTTRDRRRPLLQPRPCDRCRDGLDPPRAGVDVNTAPPTVLPAAGNA